MNRKIKRVLAIILCLGVIICSPGITEAADNMPSAEEETVQASGQEKPSAQGDKREENDTDKVTNHDSDQQRQPVIYWDPSAAADGNGHGSSEQSPIADFQQVMSEARELREKLETEITVYVMSAERISGGEQVSYDGDGIRLVSGTGRAEGDSYIFIVEGGELSLSHMNLSSAPGMENSDLVKVEQGSLIIGDQFTVDGNLFLDTANAGGRNNRPFIQVQNQLGENIKYSINANPNDDQNQIKIIAGASDQEEFQKDLPGHFMLTQNLQEKWQLLQQDAEGGNGIFLTSRQKDLEAQEDGSETDENGNEIDGNQINGNKTDGNDNETNTKETNINRTDKNKEDINNAEVNNSELNKTEINKANSNADKDSGKAILDGADQTEAAKKVVSSMARAVGSKVVYWNVNEETSSPEGDRPAIPGGSDDNSGIDDQHPVRTWEHARGLLGGDGGTVVVMSPIVIGDEEFSVNGTPITTLNGENKIALTQWDKYPTEIFIIPPGIEFSLSNLEISCKAGIGIRIADSYEGYEGASSLGKLVIGERVSIIGGSIQTELNPDAKGRLSDCTIELTTTDVEGKNYYVYYSGIDDNQEFQYADVIKGPEGSDAANYLGAFTLHSKNTDANWTLRKDTYEDSDGVMENHIELYRKFKYTGVYLNGQKGNDIWFGGNCNWPVKTFAQAKKILFDNWDDIDPQNRVIYICDTVDITGTEEWNFIDDTNTDRSSEAKIACCKTNPEWTMKHKQVPSVLVSVKDGGAFTTSNLVMEYDYAMNGNVMVDVLAGGSYTSQKGTVLKGFNSSYRGTGVRVRGAAGKTTKFTLEDGMITKKALGVSVSGVNKDDTIFTMRGGSITDNNRNSETGFGAGVYLSNARLDMTGGTISSNVSSYSSYIGYGGGIYATGGNTVVQMSGGIINKNKASGTYGGSGSSYNSYGSGVYMSGGVLKITGEADISENTGSGGYVYGSGVYINSSVEMVMDGGKISNNVTNSSYSNYGGGIYNTGGKLTISGGVIEKNKSSSYGGGVYSSSGTFLMTGGTIQDNYSPTGGGIYLSGGSSTSNLRITGGLIQRNQASNGGGIYDASSYLELGTGAVIQENNASSRGGGIYFAGSNTKLEGAEITQNSAPNGGGVYVSGTVHLREGLIADNTATQNGGGVYCGGGNTYFGDQIMVQNNSALLGSSCYSTANAWFLGGTFESGKTGAKDYGIYINVGTTSSSKNYIDPESLTLKDKIFLNTATSKLYLLNEVPVSGVDGKLPVNVNKDIFEVGSVVIAPARQKTVNAPGKTYTYAGVEDAEPYVAYFTGGEIPPKTQLGGFNKNIILVGEGVYLDGTGGSNSNGGTSPSDAVRTFDRAKSILKDKIASAKENAEKPITDSGYDPDGFEPFIYICGKVSVPADGTDQVWDLDYEAPEFVQSETLNSEGNIINTNLAQVKRFASFYGIMVQTVDNGNGGFTIGRLLMDGNAGAVDGANNTIESMVYVSPGTELTLENGIIQNNFKIGVYNSGGSVTMKGSEADQSDGALVRSHGSWAVYLEKGGKLTMQDQSGIENSQYVGNNSSNGSLPGLSGSTGGINVKDDVSGVDMYDTSYVKAPGRYGIGIYGRSSISENSMVTLNDSSLIRECSIGVYMSGTNSIIAMHDKSMLLENKDQAIYASSVSGGSRIYMDGEAEIRGKNRSGNGIYLNSITGSSDNLKIDMDDKAAITQTGYAVYNASSYNMIYTDLNMHGDSRISKNTYGVYYEYNSYSTTTASNRPQINMDGNAVIGGNSQEEKNFNQGIYSQRGVSVNLKDNASIGYNGSYGIYFGRYSSSSSYYSGPSSISMKGQSSIKNNGNDGIYTGDYISGTTVYANEIEITLEDKAQILNNKGRGIVVSSGSTLTLGDGTAVKGNLSTAIGSAVDCNGKLKLGGKAEVDKEIYIRDVKKPITLFSEPDDQVFQVGCTDNFIKQILVEPDGVLISNADTYLDHFKKTANFPKEKSILAQDPNLVVEGENNVYLAGKGSLTPTLVPGDDSNNGGSIGAPVATFARALEILKTLDTGANIIICNYPVDFGNSNSAKPSGDTWSFDEGQTFTNDKDDTWVPKVMRHEKYTGHMIQMNGSAQLTLENIVIDGNKDKFSTTGGVSGSIIYNSSSVSVVNVNSGAVLQNNRIYGNHGAGIYNYGIVNISGGSILGNEIYSSGYGAGIYNQRTINMTSGHIDDNKMYSISSNYSGAGVYNTGTFEFSGGTIAGNSMEKMSCSYIFGVALYNGGVLNMSGSAAIENNKIDNIGYSGNIYGTVYNAGTMTANGGSIRGNDLLYGGSTNSESYGALGGGLFINGGQVTISGMEIQDNQCRAVRQESASTTYSRGGGIYIQSGTLKFMSGNIQGNKANSGAGIYYRDGSTAKVEISGGVIRDNTPLVTTVKALKQNAGIYINGQNFNLKGGGSTISDRIYLAYTSYPVILGGSIYQRNRMYTIDCADSFKKGSIVVKPDNDVILDATGYLRYFNTQKAGYVLEKQAPNLVLKQCIYIDSEHGSDSNDGGNPDKAVAGMTKAKSIGGAGDYIIYTSGPVYVDKEEAWDLPETAWMSRYTGFEITDADKEWPAYTGNMILARDGANLKLGSITIYGRREIDNVIEGDSILKVEAGAVVSMSDNTVLRLNNLPSGGKGGAVYIDQGELAVNGGTIRDVSGYRGSAVYQNGTMRLANTSSISGEVYLTGTGASDTTSRYINADVSYQPEKGTVLSLNMDNPYGGRRVVAYPDSYKPDKDVKSYYNLNAAIMAVYHLENRSGEENILELQQKGVVYINGENGKDTLDGTTPKTAVETLEAAYKLLRKGGEGGVIIVVDKVTVSDETTLQNLSDTTGEHGYYKRGTEEVDALGPVYFQRYAQPDAWESLPGKDKYEIATYTGTMFEISDSGILNVDNLFFDGHSREVVGNPVYASGPVEAEGPIFHVKGKLVIPSGSEIYKNKNIAAGAKSAGVYVDGGVFQAVSVSITDVEAPNGKGSAIYQDGTCILDRDPNIEGTIHLTGSGSEGDTGSSKYIEISLRGFKPASGTLRVTLDDPYLGRPVVQYPGKQGTTEAYEPTLDEIAIYRLERSVTDIFSLGSRTGDVNVLELQYRHRVYIDGVNGADSKSGGVPAQAVRTLKKAYELLKNIGGGYLYVVDTVTINENISLTATSYSAGLTGIDIIGGAVDIRRYVVPDGMKGNSDYSSPGDHTGALFKVDSGGIFNLQDIIIEGHRDAISIGDIYEDVADSTKAAAPLITAGAGSVLNLNEGTILRDNDNSLEIPDRMEGGAVANHGTMNYDGAVLQNNSAAKGAGIYQDGYFTILYGAAGLAGQEIYLTTANTGTADKPVWGSDHVIHMQELLKTADYLDINVDNPVNGRDVAVYDMRDAYVNTVDEEYYHYLLGTTITSVSPKLYLVESETEKDTLELYNYEVLDISLPLDVFLVAVEHPNNSSPENGNIRNETLEAPVYTITNGGSYQTKISVVGFQNDNTSESIAWDEMILVKNKADLAGPDLNKKLYLAVTGADRDADNGFAGLADTPLASTAAVPVTFGTLEPGTSGRFTFTGTADTSFFEKYNDTAFGTSIADPETYIKENARAKYQMIYKFELVR